jgi:hypothetical protein
MTSATTKARQILSCSIAAITELAARFKLPAENLLLIRTFYDWTEKTAHRYEYLNIPSS